MLDTNFDSKSQNSTTAWTGTSFKARAELLAQWRLVEELKQDVSEVRKVKKDFCSTVDSSNAPDRAVTVGAMLGAVWLQTITDTWTRRSTKRWRAIRW